MLKKNLDVESESNSTKSIQNLVSQDSLSNLSGMIDKTWLSQGLDSYKVNCKKLFLS